MFTRRLSKFLLVILAFSLCTASCKFFGRPGSNTSSPNGPVNEIESDIPFSTKEPEAYQAEIVSVTFDEAEKIERKTFIARSGEKHLTIFDRGTEQETSYLKTGTQTFMIYPAKKIFSEDTGTPQAAPQQVETLSDFLTVNWLNDKTPATYENLGADGGLTKYAAKLDNAEGTSEIFIYVDENAKMPVKQEFFSSEDGEKKLLYSIEVKELKLQTDEKLFEISKDFQKVSAKEFHDITWQGKR